ncbi:sensor domain-containing diguanylate cyclase [Neptuniibacter halophilus]|uniref:sensor domain-containing diguanylate cyclase n=1 Tax=Neptuniibacter halophilus TaxID=651666 RepID=UPI002572D713|nr:diguanylate cyclase [Neptuniibacter halophilus]
MAALGCTRSLKKRMREGACLLFLLLAVAFLQQARAAIPVVSEVQPLPGYEIRYIKETGKQRYDYLAAEQEIERRGITGTSEVLNFGFGSDPVWLMFRLTAEHTGQSRVLQVENAWLDRIDLYFVSADTAVHHYQTGDKLPFSGRSHRFFRFPHTFASEQTTVLMRVESIDPMLLPMKLYSQPAAAQQQLSSGYRYGIIYGFLLALMIYNALLAMSLRSRRYLFYSIYLGCFLLLNMAYTGHGNQWLWQASPAWQNTGIPVLMILYATSGLLFARFFLPLSRYLPQINQIAMGYMLLLALLAIVFSLTGLHLWLLYSAFSGVVLFALLMMLIGVIACLNGIKEARYFLGAAVFAMISAIITALTVSGVVEYSALGFYAVEYGMLLEAVLFAFALAYQFRINQVAKLRAEQMAERDQLTGLYNRRGFLNALSPMLSNAQRYRHHACLMLLDIDHFKKINDSLGHSFGDRVLQDLSSLLQKELRNGDLVARWGGEEFLVLLPETEQGDAIALAERLLSQASNRAVSSDGVSRAYSLSIGISTLDLNRPNFENLFQEADQYLYQAKQAGRNRVCYRQATHESACV